MGILGVQSLTLALAVSMIFATGLILGGMSISTGNKSTDDARATGDRGISQCMESGGSNVRSVTAQLLLSVLMDFRTRVYGTIAGPSILSRDMVKFLTQFHPDEVANPDFMEKITRKVLFSKHLSAMEQYGYVSLAIVMWNVTPNSETLRQAYGGAWGGHLSFFVAGQYDDGSFLQVAVESRLSYPYGPFNYQDFAQYGQVNGSGHFAEGPCNYADLGQGGRCFSSLKVTVSQTEETLINRCFHNMMNPDQNTILIESDATIHSPISSTGPSISMTACTPITHPEQVNIYPRQAFRTGYVRAVIDTTGISLMMKETALPDGSVLYSLEKNLWTGKVEHITGCNVGEAAFTIRQFDERGFEIWKLGVPFPIVNHTLNGMIDGELSPIARHGRHMIEMANNSNYGEYYDHIESLPAGTVADWTDTNTSVLYWVRVASVKLLDIHWYLVLLVPRNSVMSVIDDAAEVIRVQIVKDKQDTDDERDKNYTIMYVVTATCVVILLGLSVVFTNIIISPLIVLSDDMAAVAVMETDSVNLTVALSSLSEVRAMQQSFRKMVKNLIEYKNYMPQSVLMKSDDEESEEVSAVTKSTGIGSSASRTQVSHTRSFVHHQAIEMGLKKKTISVIMFNSIGWHSRKNNDVIIEQHCSLITCLTSAVEKNKGVCDAFNGDRLMAYFNANRANSDHRSCAVKCGLMAKSDCQLPLSFATSSGEAKVGNIGIVGMKKFSILSPMVSFAAALEKYSASEGYNGLIDKRCAEHSRVHVDFRAVRLVCFAKQSEAAQLVYEAKALRKVEEEEWMYQLEAESTFGKWNGFVEMLAAGHFDEAEKLLSDLNSFTGDRTSNHWRSVCSKKNLDIIQLC